MSMGLCHNADQKDHIICFWWERVLGIGNLRTVGDQNGDKKDISDWRWEIHVRYAYMGIGLCLISNRDDLCSFVEFLLHKVLQFLLMKKVIN